MIRIPRLPEVVRRSIRRGRAGVLPGRPCWEPNVLSTVPSAARPGEGRNATVNSVMTAIPANRPKRAVPLLRIFVSCRKVSRVPPYLWHCLHLTSLLFPWHRKHDPGSRRPSIRWVAM